MSKKAFESLAPIADRLIQEVKKNIAYYEEHNESNPVRIKKVILSGKEAGLKGLSEYLSARLKIETELANPWVNIAPFPMKTAPKLPLSESLGYAGVFGLALRAAKNGND